MFYFSEPIVSSVSAIIQAFELEYFRVTSCIKTFFEVNYTCPKTMDFPSTHLFLTLIEL